MPRGASPKRERQYEHIKDQLHAEAKRRNLHGPSSMNSMNSMNQADPEHELGR
ncbi:hypothetical protein [Streptomyces sp. TBY4]|uniref:hypothetical protein n=1 Tax=Streptomyces sp. TBY4 TaxID=2962030 RepID=UPI0020B89E8B|nr:hypothetical protein [Streptomyces sp. TBY4]MCP3754589.1 hypothetical protein [Streptomyces sp. TBY4]